MLLIKTRIGPSAIHGTGLFAAERIAAGTVIWRLGDGDELLTRESVMALPEKERAEMLHYCPLLKSGLYLKSGDDDKYVNHSANPNAGPSGGEIVALRNIEAGDEITQDYEACFLEEEPNGQQHIR